MPTWCAMIAAAAIAAECPGAVNDLQFGPMISHGLSSPIHARRWRSSLSTEPARAATMAHHMSGLSTSEWRTDACACPVVALLHQLMMQSGNCCCNLLPRAFLHAFHQLVRYQTV